MSSIKNYLSLVKFSHTIFAMPFALIGFFLAIQYAHFDFDWKVLVYVVLCMIFARNSAMAFNRYIDRKIDLANPRTAEVREIPNGTINPTSALTFVVVNCALFIATTFFINTLCFYLSPIALAVVLGYSLTKRFTALCHIVLGLGLALAPIGAFLAVTGYFDWLPLFFSFAVLFWVSGFDIIYALQDEAFDKGEKLHSIPVWLGTSKALNLSKFLHMLTASFIIGAGILGDFSIIYWVGATIFIGLLIYQHLLVKPNDFSKIGLAFFTTNGIASVVFATFVLTDLFL
jgi:4-hydroxybenzoate polyprenyltransferase